MSDLKKLYVLLNRIDNSPELDRGTSADVKEALGLVALMLSEEQERLTTPPGVLRLVIGGRK